MGLPACLFISVVCPCSLCGPSAHAVSTAGLHMSLHLTHVPHFKPDFYATHANTIHDHGCQAGCWHVGPTSLAPCATCLCDGLQCSAVVLGAMGWLRSLVHDYFATPGFRVSGCGLALKVHSHMLSIELHPCFQHQGIERATWAGCAWPQLCIGCHSFLI